MPKYGTVIEKSQASVKFPYACRHFFPKTFIAKDKSSKMADTNLFFSVNTRILTSLISPDFVAQKICLYGRKNTRQAMSA